MKVISYIFPIFSLLLLAAHFSRNNLTVLSIIFLLLPLLMIIKKLWVKWVLEILLYAGSISWIYAISHYAKIREAIGLSWTRLAIILGVIALFTFLSGLLFEFKYLKNRYKK